MGGVDQQHSLGFGGFGFLGGGDMYLPGRTKPSWHFAAGGGGAGKRRVLGEHLVLVCFLISNQAIFFCVDLRN